MRPMFLLIASVAIGFAGDAATPKGVANCELLPTRHLAVQVMIDGKGPYRMIFDTGSPVVLINSKIAKECKLFDPKRPKPAVKAGQVWPGQMMLNTVEIGGVKAES